MSFPWMSDESQRKHFEGFNLEADVARNGCDLIGIEHSLKTSKPWTSLGMKPKNSLQIAIDGEPLSLNTLDSVSEQEDSNFSSFFSRAKNYVFEKSIRPQNSYEIFLYLKMKNSKPYMDQNIFGHFRPKYCEIKRNIYKSKNSFVFFFNPNPW